MTKKRYNKATQDVASDLLFATSATVTKEISALSTWFIAGSGALLAVVVSSVDKLGPYLQLGHLSGSIKLFLAAAACNVLQRWLGAMVIGSEAMVEKGKQVGLRAAQEADEDEKADLFGIVSIIKESSLPPVSWMMAKALKPVEEGDLVASARRTTRMSQIQSFLLLPQFGMLGWAAWRLLL